MDYGPSDSSGTDDDLPPSIQNNRGARGGARVTGNGRAFVPANSFPRSQSDMETQIHNIECEAYSSILRAFKAQSDAITWEKESLMTELRKELRVSDKEHRELLSRVNADDMIRRIREWRASMGTQVGTVNNQQPINDPVPSPTVSASRKRPKTSHTVPSASHAAQSPAMHLPQLAMQPSSSTAKKGSVPTTKGKKTKPGQKMQSVSSMKPVPYSSSGPTGRDLAATLDPTGTIADAQALDPLVGRKILTRWPADNTFYEAVITNCKPAEGTHLLVYDMNTPNETWEWVNLKEMAPDDIRWQGEDPSINQQVRTAHGVSKKLGGRGGMVPRGGRGRGPVKSTSKKENNPSQNGFGRRTSDDIKILHTETLLKEVERMFGTGHPDLSEVEKAKKVLKEHEQSLIEAIERLADVSDDESDEQGHHHQQPSRGWRNQHQSIYGDDMAIDSRDLRAAAGGNITGDGAASDYRNDDED